MTGPTTAAELAELARTELAWLHDRAEHGPGLDPAAVAAAWPRFERAGDQLAAVLTRQDPQQTAVAPPALHPGRPAPPAGAEPHLLRAADLLSGAADLLAGRNRSRLHAELSDSDQTYLGRRLLLTARLVTRTVTPHPQLLDTAVAGALAAVRWRQAVPASLAEPVPPATLADAMAPAVHRGALSSPVGRLETAVNTWQQAAIEASRRPAPNRLDLQHIANGAGRLLAVAAAVLKPAASLDPYGESADALDRVRRAGLAWNDAHASWTPLMTGGTARDPDLAAAMTGLHAEVAEFARARADWSRSGQIVNAGGPGPTLQAVRSALAAVQNVGEEQAALIQVLADRGAVYGSPRQVTLTATDRPLAQQLSRWTPLRATECRELQAAYRALPEVTTGARLAVEAVAYPAASRVRAEGPALGGLLGEKVGTSLVSLEDSPVADTLAGRRWAAAVQAVDPRLLQDPHYPALAAALDRVALAGNDVPDALGRAAEAPLPQAHAARALHFQLTEVCAEALLPSVPRREPERPPARAMPQPSLSLEVVAARPVA